MSPPSKLGDRSPFPTRPHSPPIVLCTPFQGGSKVVRRSAGQRAQDPRRRFETRAGAMAGLLSGVSQEQKGAGLRSSSRANTTESGDPGTQSRRASSSLPTFRVTSP